MSTGSVHAMNTHGWIPDETPILESVFVSLAPNADDIATAGAIVGIFDSMEGN